MPTPNQISRQMEAKDAIEPKKLILATSLPTDNMRYAIDFCIFGYPNGTGGAGSNPCLTSEACGRLARALEGGIPVGDRARASTDTYSYCEAERGVWKSRYFDACVQCVRADGRHRYLTNCEFCPLNPLNGDMIYATSHAHTESVCYGVHVAVQTRTQLTYSRQSSSPSTQPASRSPRAALSSASTTPSSPTPPSRPRSPPRPHPRAGPRQPPRTTTTARSSPGAPSLASSSACSPSSPSPQAASLCAAAADARTAGSRSWPRHPHRHLHRRRSRCSGIRRRRRLGRRGVRRA